MSPMIQSDLGFLEMPFAYMTVLETTTIGGKGHTWGFLVSSNSSDSCSLWVCGFSSVRGETLWHHHD